MPLVLLLLGCPIVTDAELAARMDHDGDGYVAVQFGGEDCDDARADVHPGAAEPDCTDPVDHDCDGTSAFSDHDGDGVAACIDCDDEDAALGERVYTYADVDGDGFGDPSVSTETCAVSAGTVLDATDCDDTDPSVFPGADEACDGADHDCDGATYEAESVDAVLGYADTDGDGHGDPDAPLQVCPGGAGAVLTDDDCDDADADRHPGAIEWACNGLDDDCDGASPHGDLFVPFTFSTIAAAVGAARAGEVVCVAAGSYHERLAITTSLTLEGAGASTTILDGDEGGRVVLVAADTVTLRGFTVTHGREALGAGVYLDHAVGIVLEALALDANTNQSGLGAYGSTFVLRDAEIVDNVAEGYSGEGGGLWVAGSTGLVERVRIIGNELRMSDACHGGGVYVQDSALTLRDVVIAANGCVTTDDAISASGSAVHQQGGSEVVVVGAVVIGNIGDAGASASNGGWYVDGAADALWATNVVSAGQSLSDARGCGGWCGDRAATWVLTYTDTWGNDGTAFAFADPTGRDGNLAVDPQFSDLTASDPADWDFTLLATSPLRDAGDPSRTDRDGTVSDIGVSEAARRRE